MRLLSAKMVPDTLDSIGLKDQVPNNAVKIMSAIADWTYPEIVAPAGEGLLIHSDRGSQYASDQWLSLLCAAAILHV